MVTDYAGRARSLGVSLARLTQVAGVNYRRVWAVERLSPIEIGRLEQALAELEEMKTAARLAPAAVGEEADDDSPLRIAD